MARVTCAISGVRFEVSYFQELSIGHKVGYIHPIFIMPYKSLHHLFVKHCRRELNQTESYLLFLAFLNSSDKIEWSHPVSLNPYEGRTVRLVENHIKQLITVLEKTAVIKHPRFKQPSFKVTMENSQLSQIGNWIKAWEDNIDLFNCTRATLRQRQDLQRIENFLDSKLREGKNPKDFSAIVADWAAKASEFPVHKEEHWKKIIRSCFNTDKMFKTPLADIKEVKEYCECNLEAGSVYFHVLCEILKEGISRHVDYLGGSSLALGYTILPNITGSSVEDRKIFEHNNTMLAVIASNAPETEPRKEDYDTEAAYIKARLSWRVALNKKRRDAKEAMDKKRQEAKNLEANLKDSIPSPVGDL